mmetsp:Transcript_21045/g.43310  ORF Transcript_21045/g.43310 Transcript_21045/m.43310 type:complete len:206 (-) Transcript_21045:736-1353(-)
MEHISKGLLQHFWLHTKCISFRVAIFLSVVRTIEITSDLDKRLSIIRVINVYVVVWRIVQRLSRANVETSFVSIVGSFHRGVFLQELASSIRKEAVRQFDKELVIIRKFRDGVHGICCSSFVIIATVVVSCSKGRSSHNRCCRSNSLEVHTLIPLQMGLVWRALGILVIVTRQYGTVNTPSGDRLKSGERSRWIRISVITIFSCS